MIHFSYIEECFSFMLWSNVLQIFLLFALYFSSLNLYLKLTKMELTRFAMKLFKWSIKYSSGQLYNYSRLSFVTWRYMNRGVKMFIPIGTLVTEHVIQ